MDAPTVTRRCHWLNRNAASKRPHLLVFLDTEATITNTSETTQEHTLRLASASFCQYRKTTGLVERDWKNFVDAEGLWTWIVSKTRSQQSLLVVAHNLDYDVRVSRALTVLPELGAKPKYAIISRGCTFFTFDYQERDVMLLDNMGIWPASLEEIGKSVGLEKTHVDFATACMPELADYCRNDVKILVRQWEAWLSFLDEHDMGNFAITLAGQSFNAYRHRFMKTPIGIHDNADVLELERRAYKGGRAEAFFAGPLPKSHYYKLDVNSLYPAMMLSQLYPSRLVKVLENVTPRSLKSLLNRYCVVADVALDTSEPCYPIKRENKSVYPTGQFVTTLTTPELDYAIRRRHLVGVGMCALYDADDLFSRFVNTFYTLRQGYIEAGDMARSKICKLIMNSLQGKLGQIGYSQEKLADAPPDAFGLVRWMDEVPGRTCNDVTFGGSTFRQMTGGESNNSFPAIPAHVAAYGRMYMWKLIKMAGQRNVFYTDTDSLIVNRSGYNRLSSLLDPIALSYLKIEGESTDVEIFAKKDYQFGSHRTVKGIKSNAVEVSPGVYSQWHFTSLRWGLKHSESDRVHLDQVEKTLRYGEVVGRVEASGRITPPRLTLTPGEVAYRLSQDHNPKKTVWEFDRTWLQTVMA